MSKKVYSVFFSATGTTEKIAEYICSKRPDLYYVNVDGSKSNPDANDEIYFAHCPERVLPGKILYEIENNGLEIIEE